jgi:hypothetical protein
VFSREGHASAASSTLGNPSDILFFALPPPPAPAPPAGDPDPAVARLAAPLIPAAWAGALCLLFLFFSVSAAATVGVAEASLASLVPAPAPGAGSPALVMYAKPSRWRLSELSNLAGRNINGMPREFGRENAFGSVLARYR